MHQDLGALLAHYNRLADDSRAGHITPEEAFSALTGLAVTDGMGAVWKVNIEGNFTRSEFSGAPDVVTPAVEFVDPATVSSNPETGRYGPGSTAPTSPTWDMTPPQRAPIGGGPDDVSGFGTPPVGGFGTPPAGFGTPPAPVGGLGAANPGQAGWGSQTAVALEPAVDPAGARPSKLGRSFGNHHSRSLADAEAAASRAPLLPTILSWLNTHKLLLVAIGLGVAFVLYRLSGPNIGEDLPTEADTPVSVAPDDNQPADDPAAASLPATGDVSSVTSAMVSGDRKLIAAVVTGEPTASAVAHAAAFYAGMGKAGLVLNPGPLAAGPNEATALQQWEVKSGNDTLMTVPVVWVPADGGWKLQAVPLPAD